MANVAEVIIQGTDRTGPAMRSALANVRRVSAETKAFGGILNSVGAVAEKFGGSQLAGMIGGLQSAAMSAASVTKEFGKTSAGIAALGAVGFQTGIVLADGLYDAFEFLTNRGRWDQAAIERNKFLSTIEESLTRQLATSDAAYASFKRGNDELQRRKEIVLGLNTVPIMQRTGAVDILAREQEQRRVQYVKSADDEIAKLRANADKTYEDAQKAIAANEQKRRDDNFTKYLADLDAQIAEAERANRELVDQVNREAEDLERAWAEQNSGLIQLQQTREELWKNSLANMHQATMAFSATAAVAISEGIGNSLAAIATGAATAKEAFKQLGKELLGMLVKWASQLIINTVLANALQSSFAVTSAVIGGVIASAWAPAAAMVSLASYGANAIPAAAGIIATTTLAKGLAVVGAQAHGGVESVPQDQTILVQAGERIIKRDQNEELMDIVRSGGTGGGSYTINVNVGDQPLARLMFQMSRDGRMTISKKAVL